jgi:protein O-GlcNAc transferase
MRYAWIVLASVAFTTPMLAQQPTLETAWDLIGKGRRGEAITLLRQIIASKPADADARLLLGSVLMEEGQGAESVEQLRQAVRLKPGSSEAHNALGEAYNTFGQQKASRPEFEKAVEIDPRFAQAHVNLAAAMLQDGESQPAATHLDRAISLIGNTAEAAYPLYLRAKIHAEQREPAKAIPDLERAVKLRPDFAEAWSDLGEARRTLFDDEGALAAFRRAVELSPDDGVAQARYGAKLLDTGKAHEAVEHLDVAVRLDPRNQSALNSLQSALNKDGQTERASEVRRQLAALIRDRDKNDQNLVKAIEANNRGAELEKKGDVRAAVDRYRTALELQPDHVGIRTNLAVALLKLGNWDEGIAQMREALRRDPGNADLQKALDDALVQAKAHGIDISTPHRPF